MVDTSRADDATAKGSVGPHVLSSARKGEISLVAIANVFLRRRRWLVIPIVLGVGAAAVESLLVVHYVATSSFSPAGGSTQSSRLVSLAAQFGVPTTGGGQSVEFYSALVTSREILSGAATTRYQFSKGPTPADTATANLLEVYHVTGRGHEDSVRAAVRELKKRVSVGASDASNIVTIVTEADWPDLASQINARLLSLVDSFNVSSRQSQAAEERRFTEGRLAEVKRDLGAAEADLAAFLEQNRTYQNSPRLQFEADRLQRRVTLQQELYTTLAQGLEQARMDEVRDTPVLTIIDHPAGSATADRRLLRNLLLGLVLGGMIGLAAAFAVEYANEKEADAPDEYGEFRRLLRETANDFVVWRRPRRRSQRASGRMG
jgi:uncharacterized protein involved in exopolysaccharide biosynthesis